MASKAWNWPESLQCLRNICAEQCPDNGGRISGTQVGPQVFKWIGTDQLLLHQPAKKTIERPSPLQNRTCRRKTRSMAKPTLEHLSPHLALRRTGKHVILKLLKHRPIRSDAAWAETQLLEVAANDDAVVRPSRHCCTSRGISRPTARNSDVAS